ncbi:MAG: serine/threonine-protein phosphatase [Ruminococcus sp.]|nr:serine/threonine-protein phosphatase [Ruminococcus sp.]MBQ7009731.1 serine/threonine-protein phosphatase [Ruminococcus sp.]MBR4023211.1 serine/threonine-protein phosphatase [Ruminococcus sp.]
MYYCCGITEKGVMPHNEDALMIGKNVITDGAAEYKLNPPFMCAVSDGVSGELSGELASSMCLNLLSSVKYNKKTRLANKLNDIHNQLAKHGSENSETLNMQATLCGIAIDDDNKISIINIGDSRLYRFRGNHIKQISRDQSLVQLLYEEGSITHEEKKTHVHRNIIFPVLGNISSKPDIDIDVLEEGLRYGDVLLLCTDGLSDYVPPSDMEEILDMPKSLPKRLEMLVKKALENGGSDNISVIAVVYFDEGLM